MTHPTTRVLAVLDLLQSHGRMRGSELAERVGVDVRTLRRYIATLEELGIPITSERGRHGAYLLVAGFKLPPMMFNNDEAVALSVGLVAARGLGLADAAPAVASAQAKLARVMPAGLKRHVNAIADTVRIDLRHVANTPASNAALIALTAAAQGLRRVHLEYAAADGTRTEREFDPYGLAYRIGAWYAVGHCHLRHALRSFRLDRIGQVRVLEHPFTRAVDFDVLEHLLHSIAAIPRAHRIEVLLHAGLDAARKEFPLDFGVLEPAAGGVVLHGSVDDLGWFGRRLTGLPFGFDIRTPEALRTEVAVHARQVLAAAQRRPRENRPP